MSRSPRLQTTVAAASAPWRSPCFGAWLPRLLGSLLLGLPLAAQAHKPSDSYLSVTVDAAASGAPVSGRWDIALRDLDYAIGLDTDGDGRITWGEVKAHHAEIAAYAAAHLSLAADGRPCALTVTTQLIEEHTDGAYSVLPLRFACAAAGPATGPGAGVPQAITLGYRLFADLDPQHRGLLNLSLRGKGGALTTRTAVLGPQAPEQTFVLSEARPLQQLLDYGREGVWHIWVGFDHILFLLSLLLPAVGVWVAARRPARATARGAAGRGLRARPGGSAAVSRGSTASAPASAIGNLAWQPVARFPTAFWDVLRIVTAFTVAHSITLSLAVLGVVSLPSRVVESSIAASVVLAALNNVWPLFHGRRWMVAFTFGLLHGFGFASVLVDLGLPQQALALALLGFNLGVEVGQLTIVALFLPLAYLIRRSMFYRHVVLTGGSVAIAVLALMWFIERAFMIKFLPF